MRDETVPNLIQLITTASDLHSYTVHKLYRALVADIQQVCHMCHVWICMNVILFAGVCSCVFCPVLAVIGSLHFVKPLAAICRKVWLLVYVWRRQCHPYLLIFNLYWYFKYLLTRIK